MDFSAFAVIKRHPEMYFQGGCVTAAAICSYLVDDARELGAAHLRVDSLGQWHVVAADVDWLRLPVERPISFDRLFVGMHVHPTRVNGIRAEVFVGAFADAVYVATPGETQTLVGEAPPPEVVSQALCGRPYVRSVAFRFATANNRWRGP